ncbi:MAG: hypothetical protein V3V04_02935 [Rhizobiaceae bacterium]
MNESDNRKKGKDDTLLASSGSELAEQPSSLGIDIDYYQAMLDDVDIPEDKKQEFVETLWSIVVQFVDLGYGVHPLQQVNDTIDQQQEKQALARLIENTTCEEFNSKKDTILEGTNE